MTGGVGSGGSGPGSGVGVGGCGSGVGGSGSGPGGAGPGGVGGRGSMAAAYPGAERLNAIEAPGGASIYEEEGLVAPARPSATGPISPRESGVKPGVDRRSASRSDSGRVSFPGVRVAGAAVDALRAAAAARPRLAALGVLDGMALLALIPACSVVSPRGEGSDAAIVLGSLSSLFWASDGLLCFVALRTMKVTTPETSSSTRMMGIRYSM